jgi:hypothetical protein
MPLAAVGVDTRLPTQDGSTPGPTDATTPAIAPPGT